MQGRQACSVLEVDRDCSLVSQALQETEGYRVDTEQITIGVC